MRHRPRRRRLARRQSATARPGSSTSGRSRHGRTSRTSRRAVSMPSTSVRVTPRSRITRTSGSPIDALVAAYEVLAPLSHDRRSEKMATDGSRGAHRRALGVRTSSRQSRSRRRSRALDRGEVRVAERDGDGWIVNEWVKKAILLYFRLRKVEPMEVGGLHFLDKIPVKADYAARGVRVVPPGVARYGSFLAEGVVLMPGYVNIGAWVGPRTMVDTWATVGSCAQIGADVHLSGGVGIGGVLEPPQARPVIVEDGAFIGSRAVVVEGVVVGAGAVIAPNVVLSASVPVIDVTVTSPSSTAATCRRARSCCLGRGRRSSRPARYDLPVRTHRRHAERVDGSQDVAERRPARVRDRDVTDPRRDRAVHGRRRQRRPRVLPRPCRRPRRRMARRRHSSRSATRRCSSTSARRRWTDGPPNEDHFALSVDDSRARARLSRRRVRVPRRAARLPVGPIRLPPRSGRAARRAGSGLSQATRSAMP